MTKTQLAVHKLSKQEKIELVQMFWDDIAYDSDFSDLPADHKVILEERLSQINQGNVTFKSWEDIQRKYNRL